MGAGGVGGLLTRRHGTIYGCAMRAKHCYLRRKRMQVGTGRLPCVHLYVLYIFTYIHIYIHTFTHAIEPEEELHR